MSDVSTSPRYAFSGSASRPPNCSNIIGSTFAVRTAVAAACRSFASSAITLEMKARLPWPHSRTASGEGISAAAARSMINGSSVSCVERLAMAFHHATAPRGNTFAAVQPNEQSGTWITQPYQSVVELFLSPQTETTNDSSSAHGELSRPQWQDEFAKHSRG